MAAGNRYRVALCALSVTAVLLSGAAPFATAHSESKGYFAVTGDVLVYCDKDQDFCVGGVTFTRDAGQIHTGSFAVTIQDILPVSGRYCLYTSGSGSICEETVAFCQTGAGVFESYHDRLTVFIDTVYGAPGLSTCGLTSVSSGVLGTVTLDQPT